MQQEHPTRVRPWSEAGRSERLAWLLIFVVRERADYAPSLARRFQASDLVQTSTLGVDGCSVARDGTFVDVRKRRRLGRWRGDGAMRCGASTANGFCVIGDGFKQMLSPCSFDGAGDQASVWRASHCIYIHASHQRAASSQSTLITTTKRPYFQLAAMTQPVLFIFTSADKLLDGHVGTRSAPLPTQLTSSPPVGTSPRPPTRSGSSANISPSSPLRPRAARFLSTKSRWSSSPMTTASDS
jgi:hypothetical protein